jgi:death-on-curing family protein
MILKRIQVNEVEYTAFSLAKRFLEWNEPIPEFGSRFPNKLESCIETPFLRFNRKDLYHGLAGKGSILFYLMIKNHPFKNGNKRIAITSLLYFLVKNGKWLKMPNSDLYRFAKYVAESNPQHKEVVVDQIERMIKKHLINFEQ